MSGQPLSEFSGSAPDRSILVGRRGRGYSPPDPSSGFATVTCKYNLTFKGGSIGFFEGQYHLCYDDFVVNIALLITNLNTVKFCK